MIVLGLTGSIGTGKSTTAGLFRDAGIPVNDSDQVVHALYRDEAVGPVGRAFPGSVIDGTIDRPVLSRLLAAEPQRFSELEAIVHPLVRAREDRFLVFHRSAGTACVLLDIPLLFESGSTERVDRIILVTCDPALQRQRVLARPGMTVDKFEMILARQMPDAQKRARADFIVNTDHGLDAARSQVQAILAQVLNGPQGSNHA